MKLDFLRSWWNWQTRMLEVHVPERVWRLKSSRPHQNVSGQWGREGSDSGARSSDGGQTSTSHLRFGHRHGVAASPIPKYPKRQDVRFSRTFGVRSRA